jgi:hypothetical protein
MGVPYRVAIVVDRQFGPQLGDLAGRLHVWVCDSPANRPAAEAIWRARGDGEYDIESGATLFNCAPDEAVEDALVDIIGTVDEHHGKYSHDPPWSVIEVIGCNPSPRVQAAFAALGAQITGMPPDRFEARRPTGGAG